MKNKIIVVTGLGFGDEGKAVTTEYYVAQHQAREVCRYNGGPQAAHNVVLASGTHHCFSQFNSASFNGIPTFLSSQMLVNPITLLHEARVLGEQGLENALALVTIDPHCLIVTPFHKHLNRMFELSRGDARHGSCGMGVGQAIFDSEIYGEYAIRITDLFYAPVLRSKLKFSLSIKLDQAEQLIDKQPHNIALRHEFELLRRASYVDDLVEAYQKFIKQVRVGSPQYREGLIVFEGAQGMLLDRTYGFHPHVTKSDVSTRSAIRMANKYWPTHDVVNIGVLRAYATRHGVGPFVSENSLLGQLMPDKHNGHGEWQGSFRVGWFDLVASRYALDAAGGVDYLSLTNLDRLTEFGQAKICVAYEYAGQEELSEYFDWQQDGEKKIIKRIKMCDNPSAERQARLAQLLNQCRPIYEGLDVRPERVVEKIQTLLGVPISLVSFGPTIASKKELISIF